MVLPPISNIPGWSTPAKQQLLANYNANNPRGWTQERWALLGQNTGVNEVDATTAFARMPTWPFGSVNTLVGSYHGDANGLTGDQWVQVALVVGYEPSVGATRYFCQIANWTFPAILQLATAYAADRAGMSAGDWQTVAQDLPNDDVDGAVAICRLGGWGPAPKRAVSAAYAATVGPLLVPVEWAALCTVGTTVPANDSARATALCRRDGWVSTATNDTVDRDWLVWETQGNTSPIFRRAGKTRELGLYRIDYDLARKAGTPNWQPGFGPADELGGGWVKVVVVEGYDYRPHADLIDALLPCYAIDAGTGALQEPAGAGAGLYAVLPYNFDDNTRTSLALGTKLRVGALTAVAAARLQGTLPRWATASRSTVAQFAAHAVDPAQLHVYGAADNVDWPFRDYTPATNNLVEKIAGPTHGQTLTQAQAGGAVPTYSVKTGVQWVASSDQGVHGKDRLESNSVHAMHRSELIHRTRGWSPTYAFEAGYQIEILSILLNTGVWDGIQVREIGNAGAGEVWFPALAIPGHGRPFAATWGNTAGWRAFWQTNFAETLGRAKAEMLCMFGMQQMTANAQNMISAFTAADVAHGGAFQRLYLRDLGDTLLNNVFFAALGGLGAPQGAWYTGELAREQASPHGITLTHGTIGGGYADPRMTRLGTSIVFFFAPFVQGDLATGEARTLTEWGIAHNQAFRQFFIDHVGYTGAWQAHGPANLPAAQLDQIEQDILQYGGYALANQVQYDALVPRVLGLSSADRQTLLGRYEAMVAGVGVDDLAAGKRVVDAHDMVMGGEIQDYVASAGGALAVRALHH